MKANELMIGDLVYNHRNWICPIVEIHKDSAVIIARYYGEEEFKLDDLRPIPLTSEILEKNGFDKRWHDISKCIIFDPRNDHVASTCYNYHNATISIEDMPFVKVNKHNERNQKIENIGCQYVHELQHALRLCGIEKEIEL